MCMCLWVCVCLCVCVHRLRDDIEALRQSHAAREADMNTEADQLRAQITQLQVSVL